MSIRAYDVLKCRPIHLLILIAFRPAESLLGVLVAEKSLWLSSEGAALRLPHVPQYAGISDSPVCPTTGRHLPSLRQPSIATLKKPTTQLSADNLI